MKLKMGEKSICKHESGLVLQRSGVFGQWRGQNVAQLLVTYCKWQQ